MTYKITGPFQLPHCSARLFPRAKGIFVSCSVVLTVDSNSNLISSFAPNLPHTTEHGLPLGDRERLARREGSGTRPPGGGLETDETLILSPLQTGTVLGMIHQRHANPQAKRTRKMWRQISIFSFAVEFRLFLSPRSHYPTCSRS